MGFRRLQRVAEVLLRHACPAFFPEGLTEIRGFLINSDFPLGRRPGVLQAHCNRDSFLLEPWGGSGQEDFANYDYLEEACRAGLAPAR